MTRPIETMRVLRGMGISPGIGLGRAIHAPWRGRMVFRMPIPPQEIESEVQRFRHAVHRARHQLLLVRDRLERALGKEHAYILDAHLLMLQDTALLTEIETLIRTNGINAEWAIKLVTDRILAIYAEITDEYLRERRSDVEDVATRLITLLMQDRAARSHQLPQGAVLVCETLPPSILGELDPTRIAGLVIGAGGWTSHAAILARGLGIPAVAGVHNALSEIEDQAPVLVEGTQGLVIVHPDPQTLRHYEEQRAERERRWSQKKHRAPLPTTTRDGLSITIRANIERPSELEEMREVGACGIGLLRTEFLFFQSAPELPSEDVQWRAYRHAAEAAGPDGVVIRTVDWDENQMAALGIVQALRDHRLTDGHTVRPASWIPEKNPALGLRALRFSLRAPDVLRTQLRAIARAARFGAVRLVLPLVTSLDEVRAVRRLLDQVLAEVSAEEGAPPPSIPVGVMIETPAAVLLAEDLASVADFFSLGTNDLVQYLLAVDRDNDRVAPLYDPLHPAVLRALRAVVRAAHRAGRPLEVCGEMAAHPLYALVLIGLDVRTLSMRPRAIPLIKDLIRQCDRRRVSATVEEVLSLSSATEVRERLLDLLQEIAPEFLDEASLPESP